MDNFKILFHELDEIVMEKYKAIPLYHLAEIEFDGKHPLTFFTEIAHKKKPRSRFDLFESYSEIDFLHKDIKYYTALVYLLRPYINNPIRENYTYYQTLYDKRYMSYASIVFQCFYNYWDRLGDLIYTFFNINLKERAVYFASVIKNFPQDYQKSSYYSELNDIFENHLKKLFETRKRIVHYLQIASKMYTGTFIHHRRDDKLKELQDEKEGYPEFFKFQLELTIKGFELTLKLIDELPDKDK